MESATGCSLVEPVSALAGDGDLIFRRGVGQESALVSLLDSRGYSHVGLVQATSHGMMVVHALPRERDGGGGYVVQTPLAEFLAPGKAGAAALYRLAGGIQNDTIAAAVDWAHERALGGTPFDHAFDATDSGALYCTELVWAAFRSAGVDLLPAYTPRSLPMHQVRASVINALSGGLRGDAAGLDLILPGDLAESSLVQPVAVFERDSDYCPQADVLSRTASASMVSRPGTPHTDAREAWRAAQGEVAGPGSLWFEQSPILPFENLSDFDFVDNQTGMAVSWSNMIMHTEDGGITWASRSSALPGTSIQWQGIAYSNANVATVVGSDYTADGIRVATAIRTEDGGVTWTSQDLGLPTYDPLAVAFADSDNGVIVGREGEKAQALPVILHTADGGENWQEVMALPPNFFGEIASVAHVEADTYVAAGFALDIDTGLGQGVILRSTDGGVSWQEQLVPTAELSSITFVDADTGFVVGNAGMIMRTDDGGQTWTTLQTGSDAYLLSVSCANAQHCVTVGAAGFGTEAGRVLRTSDGGQTWTPVVSEVWAQTFLRAVHHVDTDTVLIGVDGTSLQYGLVLRSVDGGESWVQQDFDQIREGFYGNRSLGLTDIAALDSGTAIAVGGTRNDPGSTCRDVEHFDIEGGIFRTDDDGVTWRNVTPGPVPTLNGVTFWDYDNGIAFGCAGAVFRTMDGGNTWLPRESGSNRHLQAAHVIAPNTVVLVGGRVSQHPDWGSVILKSADGGDTWDSLPVPEDYAEMDVLDSGMLRDVFFADADTGFAGGGSAGVISIVRTLDGGETWFTQEIGLCGQGESVCQVAAIRFSSPDTGIILVRADSNLYPGSNLYYDTRILRTADGGESWNDVTPAFLQPEARLDSVYFADEAHGMIAGQLSSDLGPLIVIRTSDGGATWAPDETDIGWRGSLNGIALNDGNINKGLMVGVYPANRANLWSSIVLRNTGGPTFPVSLRPGNAHICLGDEATIPVAVELGTAGGYTGTLDLYVQGLPGGVTSDLPPAVVPPAGVQWSLEAGSTVAAGRHVFALTANDGVQQQAADFHLHVLSPDQAPVLIEPAQGLSDMGFQPTLTWRQETDPGSYQIQVATDPGFQTLLIDEETGFYSFKVPALLAAGTEYFWRVRAVHDCGEATWSEVFSFVTADQPAGSVEPQALTFWLAADESASDVVDIVNTGVGDLAWSIETALPPATANPAPASFLRHSVAGVSDGRAVQAAAMDQRGSLASLFGGPLPGWQPRSSMNGVVDCDGVPGLVINDDGTIEDGYQSTSIFPSSSVMLVDRFTPRTVPVSFRAVCLAWLSIEAAEVEFEIVIFDDDGPGGSPGTELGALRSSTQDIPVIIPGPLPPALAPIWFSYDLTALDVTIESGSVYIGVRKQMDTVFLAADESPDRPVGFAGGYGWSSADGWQPIESRFPEYRSLFVRPVEGPATGCSDPGTLSWLEVSPGSGVTPQGQSTPVDVTVNATGLANGEYRASLCISLDDHRPAYVLRVVPVTLVVEGSGGSPDSIFQDRFEGEGQ